MIDETDQIFLCLKRKAEVFVGTGGKTKYNIPWLYEIEWAGKLKKNRVEGILCYSRSLEGRLFEVQWNHWLNLWVGSPA